MMMMMRRRRRRRRRVKISYESRDTERKKQPESFECRC
jgi:hypothetical protein